MIEQLKQQKRVKKQINQLEAVLRNIQSFQKQSQ